MDWLFDAIDGLQSIFTLEEDVFTRGFLSKIYVDSDGGEDRGSVGDIGWHQWNQSIIQPHQSPRLEESHQLI